MLNCSFGSPKPWTIMMTSSNGNIFGVTGHLCREFTGPRWIPRTKASDAELWRFLLICVWINSWVSNHEAVDLRRYRAHYDGIVMMWSVVPNAFHWGDCGIQEPARYWKMTVVTVMILSFQCMGCTAMKVIHCLWSFGQVLFSFCTNDMGFH